MAVTERKNPSILRLKFENGKLEGSVSEESFSWC